MLRAIRFQAKLGFTIHERHARADRAARAAARADPARAAARRIPETVPGGLRPARLRAPARARAASSTFSRRRRPGSRRRRMAWRRALIQRGPREHRSSRAGGPAGDADVPVRRAAVRADLGGGAAALRVRVCRRARRSPRPPTRSSPRQNRRIGIPKRFSIPMREMLALQPRFHRREGRRALAFIGHPRFRAAYDFLVLRAESGGEDPGDRRVVDRDCRNCRSEQQRSASAPTIRSRRAARRCRPAPSPSRRPAAPGARRPKADAAGCLAARLCRPRQQSGRSAPAGRTRIRRACGSSRHARSCCRSSLWRSAPMGPQDQPEFINAVAGLLTRRDRAHCSRTLRDARTAHGQGRARGTLGAARRSTSTSSDGRRRPLRRTRPAVCRIRACTSAISCCILWPKSPPSLWVPDRGRVCRLL